MSDRPNARCSEMLSFRLSPQERIALTRLATRNRKAAGAVLRDLITQADQAQRTQKRTATVAMQTNAPAAK